MVEACIPGRPACPTWSAGRNSRRAASLGYERGDRLRGFHRAGDRGDGPL